ncbi:MULTISPECIES: LysR family transcriptional regulator [unclassified Vibrio]|uniref:LysR family transcriptional regulator n=1 Tax=unclassified Vibrio TaxID=2614977 RepID=UPI001267AE15|nr:MULTISPECIES: LysR family transcriptional regulator [unclassified Vibrio]MCM5507786.1 LysR family transcriptional regulator [Vibrio sp. SCSIO 43169]QFT38993.1 HTH-type transcriptional regulator DmlR [Vibrio sp. THAF64]QGM36470.1 HTH-type transcriptional regulator DmlR [Vibrio sp. THAF191d]QGN71810.1 HTH-type transcriptional regulator DmlR [Vibrio sp. THAF191c]
MNSIFGNIDDLYLFCCVVEEGSLLAASKKLQLPVSTMSRRLSTLEQRLNIRLLEKKGRELVATQSGVQAFELLQSGMESIESGFGQMVSDTQQVSGKIKLAIPHNFYRAFVGDVVEQFLVDYPKVSLDLVLSQEQAVPQTDRDLLITFDLAEMNDMIARPLFKARHAFFASPEYIEKVGVVEDLQQLSKLDWVSVDHALDISIYEQERLVDVMTVKPKLIVNDILAVCGAVEKGLGVASLPFRHVHKGMNIVRVLPQYQRSVRQAYLVYKQRRYQPKALTLLVERLMSGVAKMQEPTHFTV